MDYIHSSLSKNLGMAGATLPSRHMREIQKGSQSISGKTAFTFSLLQDKYKNIFYISHKKKKTTVKFDWTYSINNSKWEAFSPPIYNLVYFAILTIFS